MKGGATDVGGGTEFVSCQVAEKGSARLKLTVAATWSCLGPAARYRLPQLGVALERLHAWQPPTIFVTTDACHAGRDRRSRSAVRSGA